MPKIMDLGELTGDILLFGGPYSNFHALSALMDWADDTGIPASQRLCTGDVVAYGADPKETIAMLRDHSGPIVAGDCETQLIKAHGNSAGGLKQDGMGGVNEWTNYTVQQLNKVDIDWLADCPDRLTFSHCDTRYVVLHGGAEEATQLLWPVSPEDDFWQEISQLQREVGAFDAVVAGHCGVAFERNIDGVHWINAGAIGLPENDGSTDTSFAVLTPNGVRLERLSYDFSKAAKAMEKAGLSQGYDITLRTGFWPSEASLPMSMRR